MQVVSPLPEQLQLDDLLALSMNAAPATAAKGCVLHYLLCLPTSAERP
jgi:hypothetical protein